MCARGMSSWSSKPAASSANISIEYGASGLSLCPVPRLSKVMVRNVSRKLGNQLRIPLRGAGAEAHDQQQRLALPGRVVVEVHIADLEFLAFRFPSGGARRRLYLLTQNPCLLHILDGISGQRRIRSCIGPIERSVLRIEIAHQLDRLARGNLKFDANREALGGMNELGIDTDAVCVDGAAAEDPPRTWHILTASISTTAGRGGRQLHAFEIWLPALVRCCCLSMTRRKSR